MINSSSFSIIIPTYNEESIINQTIDHISSMKPGEIVVVDGGSTDKTCLHIQSHQQVKLLYSQKGRAKQMNLGASNASGDILLFLHADTRLPENALKIISERMNQDNKLSGGRFRVGFDKNDFKYKLISWYTRFAVFSYGDQAFFVRRNAFNALGGFDPEAGFEDVDFFARLKKKFPVQILPYPVKTSSRRFEKTGFVKQKIMNIYLTLQMIYNKNGAKRIINERYKDVR